MTASEGDGGAGSFARRRWWILGVLAFLAVAYALANRLIAYTADAYVRSDLVAVAPEVAGVVRSVAVTDNQTVAVGDLLAEIDPEPYQLAGALESLAVAGAVALVAIRAGAEAEAAADIASAQAGQLLGQRDFTRVKSLTADGAISQEALDKATDQQSTSQAALAAAQAKAQVSAREADAARVAAAQARARLAIAQYSLSRTRLTAPVAGEINNLTLRPGAYVAVGQPVVGIVDASQWRVVANFTENVAASTTPGMRVWVWLDSHPWHLYPGRVQGVGRAIARQQGPAELLPYVAPTTDWIRLRRRLPVTILLDPPMPPGGLFMGADARVFFWR